MSRGSSGSGSGVVRDDELGHDDPARTRGKAQGMRLERTIPSLAAVASAPAFGQSINARGVFGRSQEEVGMELLFDGGVRCNGPPSAPPRTPNPPESPFVSNRPRIAVGDGGTGRVVLPTRGVVASGAVPLRFAGFAETSRRTNLSKPSECEDSEESSGSESEGERKGAPMDFITGLRGPSFEGIFTTNAAARAEDTISRQQAERAQLSAHYQRLRQDMRPPPPITLADLEQHPLKSRRQRMAGVRDESSDEEEHTAPKGGTGGLSQAHLDTFAPRTRSVEVKRLLLQELQGSEASARQQRTARALGGGRGGSDIERYSQMISTLPESVRTRFPALTQSGAFSARGVPVPPPLPLLVEGGAHSARGVDNQSTFFVTDVVLPPPPALNQGRMTPSDPSVEGLPSPSRGSLVKGRGGQGLGAASRLGQHDGENVVHTNNNINTGNAIVATASRGGQSDAVGTYSARDSSLSLEKLTRDPSAFNSSDRDRRHAQHYRDVAATRAGPRPKPATAREHMVAASSDDVKDFLFSLSNRNGRFNDAALNELVRVRTAQRVFYEAKKAEIERLLEDPSHLATPSEKLLLEVRRTIGQSALSKDTAERLDVYYDHLDRLERYSTPRFLSADDRVLLGRFLALVRGDVSLSDGNIGTDGYVVAWGHYKALFGYESLLETHKVEMLKLLSSMYGISRDRFRLWLHKKLRRYEPKDLNAVFRSQDLKLGRDTSNQRRIRLTVHQGKSMMPNDGADHQNIYIRIIAESNVFTTGPKPLVGSKVRWDRQFTISLLDDQSPIRVQVVIDEATCGEGVLTVASFAVGSPLSIQLPVSGATIPYGKLDMELLLLQTREPPPYMASVGTLAGGASQIGSMSSPQAPGGRCRNRPNPFAGHDLTRSSVSPRKPGALVPPSRRPLGISGGPMGGHDPGTSTPSLFLSSSAEVSSYGLGDESDNEF